MKKSIMPSEIYELNIASQELECLSFYYHLDFIVRIDLSYLCHFSVSSY